MSELLRQFSQILSHTSVRLVCKIRMEWELSASLEFGSKGQTYQLLLG